MGRSLPTEESLGLSPTEEEMNSVADIGYQADDSGDDVPLDTDEGASEQVAAKPGEGDKPKTEDDPNKATEEPKTVDLRALQEARNEAREAKQSSRVMEQRLNDVLAMMQRGSQPAQAEQKAPEVPQFNLDPLNAGAWTQKEFIEFRDQILQERQQAEQQAREEQEYQAIQSRVVADYEAASQADPALPQMYDKLRESMGNELLALGYTQQQAVQQLNQTERSYVQYSHQTGIPVADLIRKVATARGITAQAVQQAAQAPQQRQVDPAAVSSAQQRHMSLSDAPGGEAPPVMDAKALARMSDKQFKAWMSQKGNDAKFEEIMGKA